MSGSIVHDGVEWTIFVGCPSVARRHSTEEPRVLDRCWVCSDSVAHDERWEEEGEVILNHAT